MQPLQVAVVEDTSNRIKVVVEDDNNLTLVLASSSENVQCVLIAEQGPAGTGSGTGVAPYFEAENVTANVIKAGQLVWMSFTGAQLADATTATKPVVGIAVLDVAPTMSGKYQYEANLTLSNWTDATGSATLTPGSYYYLSDVAGKMQPFPPAGNGRSFQQVGFAVTPNTLAINIINYGRRA